MTARRRAAYAALFIFLAAAAAYALFWVAAAKEMQKAIAGWAGAQQAVDLYVAYGSIRAEGFPAKLRGVVDEAVIGDRQGRGWRARALRVEANLLSPRSLVLSTQGGQTLDAGRYGQWRIDAPDGRARISAAGANGWRLAVSAGPWVVERLDRSQKASAAKLDFALAPDRHDPTRIEARLELNDATIAFGSEQAAIKTLKAEIAIAAAPALAEGAPAWRAAGGRADIGAFRLEVDGATLTATGALSLDAAGFPEGALETRIANPGALALLLGKFGALGAEDARKAQASLTLAALAGGGELSGLLVFKDGAVSFSGIRLARLSRVRFGPAQP
ncbi:MAG: DUF2125 domain-containing protein [Alphaproteobacteria bacterium]|nr:DUF2125 domain-containing protein [Alphaproteobacteria bacterium]